ncbi:MAG TPA: hypothetical protein VFF09_04215, partial [archaeon]|nr:hypothetical protein [archaeon]
MGGRFRGPERRKIGVGIANNTGSVRRAKTQPPHKGLEGREPLPDFAAIGLGRRSANKQAGPPKGTPERRIGPAVFTVERYGPVPKERKPGQPLHIKPSEYETRHIEMTTGRIGDLKGAGAKFTENERSRLRTKEGQSALQRLVR